MSNKFILKSRFKPAGDQPEAIKQLLNGLNRGDHEQTLLGVTGSGKTFTVANVIAKVNKPTLVIAHNKTLAAQLAQEYRDFFPENAVHYFVSYYDYYQPEAYMPITDTYIEKDAQINKEIDRLRHASTQALLTRKDVIIVASVSCIYGLGSPEEYEKANLLIKVGEPLTRQELFLNLIKNHYTRTSADLTPGTFRATGDRVEVMPTGEEVIFSITLAPAGITQIQKVNPVSREILTELTDAFLFPAKHFVTTKEEVTRAIKLIKEELDEHLKWLNKGGKILEAERLKRRTNYDIAMIRETGYCSGIENYSRHMSGRPAGEPPDTLLAYFPQTPDGKPDFLTIIDESHVTIPQVGGMYAGDQSRKKTLIEHGFRLPSAADNRPLKFNEFMERVGQIIYTSATPSDFERERSAQIVEQIIRPTGLVDPEIEVRGVMARTLLKNTQGLSLVTTQPYPGQIKDFITEAEKVIKGGTRVIATTLTKKMTEDLSTYLKEKGIKAEYLHSEIKTIERIKILTDFRKGKFDCLVGVNLLREGLDLPEVSLIGILDADKEGFLRSEVSLIQTIGRAARNAEGRVILYGDNITGSMKRAIDETNRRREIQLAYNKKNHITPKTIIKNISDITQTLEGERGKALFEIVKIDKASGTDKRKLIRARQKQMSTAIKELDFETAALLRDEIKMLKGEM